VPWLAAFALPLLVVVGLAARPAYGKTSPAPAAATTETVGFAGDLAEELRVRGFSGVLEARAGNLELFHHASRRDFSRTTAFWVGSVSKQFAAVAALRLVDRGKMRLDGSLAGQAGLALGPLGERYGSCSLAQVLHHTCGLPAGNACLATDLDGRGAQERFLRCVGDMAPGTPPGAGFEYSNAGYDLVGILVSRAAGVPYGHFLRQDLLEPLGMRHTGDRFPTGRLRLAQGEAFWGFGWLPTWPWLLLDPAGPGRSGASGNLFSSVADLHAWNRALHGGRLLAPATYRRLVTPASKKYGLGVAIEAARDGSAWIWHNGSLAPMGWSAFLAYAPARDLSVVGLANRSHHTSLIEPASRRLVLASLGSQGAPRGLEQPAPEDLAIELAAFVFPILLGWSVAWIGWTLVRGPGGNRATWYGALLAAGALYLYAVSLIDFYGRTAAMAPLLLAATAVALIAHRRSLGGPAGPGFRAWRALGSLWAYLLPAAFLVAMARPEARLWFAAFALLALSPIGLAGLSPRKG